MIYQTQPYPEYSKSFIGSLFGCIVAFCYYQTMYLHLWKSMNRTYAAVFPIHYHTKFTIKIGNIILVITIVMSAFAINQFFEYQCNYHFDPMSFLWRQREPTCSQIRQISLISLLTTVIGCVICDTITFCVMIILKKKIYSGSNKAYEMRFFIQTCLSTVVYVFLTLSFKVFAAQFATTQELLILFVTIAWQLFHLLNQLVFVVFSIKKAVAAIKVTPNSILTPSKPIVTHH
uniref:7TM GPCR serpentine receptor class x (Srx) domain-containing protein n=1 Tax=Panagrolaimus davidi TaxID=227884 RepID=A0A914QKV2_9BILA